MGEAIATGCIDLRQHLLGAVAGIADALAAQCDAEDAQGYLSRTSHNLLYDAGILAMKTPRELGGHEADLVTQFEVLEAITRVNPAAAWCAMVGTTSLGLPGAFLPEAGMRRMFAGERLPRGAILIMPSARAVPVDGGFSLTGRWSFASGVQHAEWIAAHALVGDGRAPPLLHMLVFPAGEASLHDNWQVLGLRGTGSCDISVEDLFVPAACAWDVAAQPPQRGGPLYRLGIPAFVAYEHAAFATGLARRALDTLTAYAQSKKRGYGPDAQTLADRALVQRLIGRGDLQLRAARALTMELNATAMDTVLRGDAVEPRLALELRGAAVHCTEVACEIVTAAFRQSGAGAIYEKHVMQGCLRDINVAAQHLMVSESAYELLGQSHLGFADINPMA
ncbi:MAG: acyl-CoA dehydrogenase family protein [Gammaproteobacteria bacterium]|nr:acyl-CoA dehydrogenase family protein [Gammaproteobacteria bacterium]